MPSIPLEQACDELTSIATSVGLSLHRPTPGLVWIAYRNFSRLRFEAPVSVLRFATRIDADAKRDFYSVTLDRLFCDQPLEVFARQPNLEICYTLGYRMFFEPDEELLLCSEFRTSNSADHDRDFFAEIEKLPVFTFAFIDRQPFRVEIASWGAHTRRKNA